MEAADALLIYRYIGMEGESDVRWVRGVSTKFGRNAPKMRL